VPTPTQFTHVRHGGTAAGADDALFVGIRTRCKGLSLPESELIERWTDRQRRRARSKQLTTPQRIVGQLTPQASTAAVKTNDSTDSE